jgi:TetR/AcrR family transcriptional regulator, transcriptional repressor for nem operon
MTPFTVKRNRRPVHDPGGASGFIRTDELLGTADDIAARLDRSDAETARTDALAVFGFMLGTLQLARALTDRDLSDGLLARGVETALKLLDDG